MTAGPSHQQQAQAEAARLAAGALAGVDLAARCSVLGLPAPDAAGTLRLRLFGREIEAEPPEFRLRSVAGGAPVKEGDRILLLHALARTEPPSARGELVSFRDFPGGAFYWEPFRARSAAPLARRIGGDLARLREHLGRFDWEPAPHGDLGARITVFGRFAVTLVYRAGDEEFPAQADVLFDAGTPRWLCAEDAAWAASRVCLGLL